MPGPAPNVPYSGVPEVEPQVRTFGRRIESRATPDDFGAQAFGAARQLGTNLTDIAIQRQGMLNETLATNAETDYMTQLGAITTKYNNLEGLAAVAAHGQTTSDIAALRQQVSATLPNPMAQRAFNMLAQRHEAYALQDVARYSATQQKWADNQSAQASMTNAIGRAGDINVASDDARFNGDVLRTADFQIVRQLNNQGYGPDSGSGMRQDARTGEVTFDDTQAGQMARAKYEEMQNKAHGQAWEIRLQALTDHDLATGYDVYTRNRGRIPGATQAKMDAFFAPKVLDEQARKVGFGAVSEAASGWTGRASQAPQSTPGLMPISGKDETEAYIRQGAIKRGIDPDIAVQVARSESGLDRSAAGDGNSSHGVFQLHYGGVAPGGNAVGGLGDDFTKATGLDARDPDTTSAQIDFALDHAAKNGWGAFHAWKGDPYAGIKAQPLPPGTGGQIYQTQTDFLLSHAGDIMDRARAQAEALHPGDEKFAETVVSHAERQLGILQYQQRQKSAADDQTLIQAMLPDKNGKRPFSVDEMLARGGPAAAEAWTRLQIENSQKAESITKVIDANRRSALKGEAGYDAEGADGTFRRITDGIFNRQITDPAQIYRFRDRLTQAGFDKAMQLWKESPVHEQVQQMIKSELHRAEMMIVNPIYDPNEPENAADVRKSALPADVYRYENQFLPAFYKAYDSFLNPSDEHMKARSSWELLGDGPDNLVNRLMHNFKQTPQDAAAAAVGAKPVEDDRSWWQRNVPTALGGKYPLGSQQNPIIPQTNEDIQKAPPGSYIQGPTGLLRKPVPAARPGAPQP